MQVQPPRLEAPPSCGCSAWALGGCGAQTRRRTVGRPLRPCRSPGGQQHASTESPMRHRCIPPGDLPQTCQCKVQTAFALRLLTQQQNMGLRVCLAIPCMVPAIKVPCNPKHRSCGREGGARHSWTGMMRLTAAGRSRACGPCMMPVSRGREQ